MNIFFEIKNNLFEIMNIFFQITNNLFKVMNIFFLITNNLFEIMNILFKSGNRMIKTNVYRVLLWTNKIILQLQVKEDLKHYPYTLQFF